jgi:integrase/recombinase XerD
MNGSSALSKAIDYYLASKRQLGFALTSEGSQLRSLARHAQEHGNPASLTIEVMIGWAQKPANAQRPYQAKRLAIARRFARFQSAFDPATQVPAPGLLGSAVCRRAVHLYTLEELQALLQATLELKTLQPRVGQTYHTLLGLLWCTGLRISEALHLQCEDIDWSTGVLIIRGSKFGQGRLVPVSGTTLTALAAYQQQRPRDTTAAFFTLQAHHPLCYERARKVFRQLTQHLGWTAAPLPRLHDFRHTFAVNTLIGWHEQKIDVQERIFWLSTYLGHRCLKHTYWYLSAVPKLMSLVAARLPDPLASRKGALALV